MVARQQSVVVHACDTASDRSAKKTLLLGGFGELFGFVLALGPRKADLI
jgi:hypothetical protein